MAGNGCLSVPATWREESGNRASLRRADREGLPLENWSRALPIAARNLLAVFQEANWRVDLEENMPGMLWKKFSYLAGSAAVGAATRTLFGEMRTIPETRAVIQGAIEEILEVGRASGAPIMEDSLEWCLTSLDNFPATGMSSLGKDFLEGRPVELDGLTGTAIRMGRELGVPTPINDTLYGILKPWAIRIEQELTGGNPGG